MSLGRPRAVIVLDGRRLTSAEAALVRARVRCSFSGGHDQAELIVWRASKFASASVGASLSIAVGHDGDEEDVWTGVVAAVTPGVDAVVIDGLATTVALSRTRMSQSFMDQSVADIVNQMASHAKVPIDQVEGDLMLPAYAVDDRRSSWAHILDLARLVGADVGSSPTGALRFVPVKSGGGGPSLPLGGADLGSLLPGNADMTLRVGADVLAWRGGAESRAPTPTLVAHGAASEAGAPQWHWPLRSPATGALVQGALRTRAAAEAMTAALGARAARAAVATQVRTVGRADVRPGDLIDVSDLPGAAGPLRVVAVDHVLDTRQGFTTTLTCEGGS